MVVICNKWMAGNLLLAGILVLMLASCSDVPMNGSDRTADDTAIGADRSNTDTGHINVHLTDEPAAYDEVNIEVEGLRIFFAAAEDDTAESDTTDEDGRWIDLPVDTMRINLLELQNGVDTLLTSADLEPGFYREIRLILGDDNDVVIDSVSHKLKVPSGGASGYKIKLAAELEAGQTLDITIDFDAAESVHKAGNSGKHILKPVLRAFVEESDDGGTET